MAQTITYYPPQRWSRNFGPVVKVDRMKKEVIQNEETNKPFARVQRKGAHEAIREEMTLAELSKKYDVHSTQIGTLKGVATENMATAFTRRGGTPEQVSATDFDKLHSKIGQLVVEWDFLADALRKLLRPRGKKW